MLALRIAAPTAGVQSPCTTDTTGKKPDPFAFADFTWLNGNARTKDSPVSMSYLTGEFRVDVNYIASLNYPKDHTLVGASESGRANEVQHQQLGIAAGSKPGARGQPSLS